MNLRITLAAAAALCLSPLASLATEPQDTFQELAKCAAIPDATPRLACFDAQMPRVRAALAAAPEQLSNDDQTTLFGLDFSNLFGSSHATTPQQFGAENLPRPEGPGTAQPIDSISAGVTDYAITPFGKFIVFLDNGQVWRQIEGDTATARFRSRATDNKVTISRGALVGFTLAINGGNAIYRVRRVK